MGGGGEGATTIGRKDRQESGRHIKFVASVAKQRNRMGGSTSMVSKDKALPGRAAALPISPKHFVLGTPMQGAWPEGFKVMIFANGCFWGSEKGAWRLPGGGVHTTAVGYAAGITPNPSYEEVCSGGTGHTEAVQAIFDPSKISFVDILRWFWESHDPTQGMGQGNDRGTQYRSGIYYLDDEQKQLIEASKAAYQQALGQARALRRALRRTLRRALCAAPCMPRFRRPSTLPSVQERAGACRSSCACP